jgi:hypothetical protein
MCGAGRIVREQSGQADQSSFAALRPAAGVFGGIRIEVKVIMKRPRSWSGRRALGSIPKLEVAQDSFDDGAIVDQTDELHGETAAGTAQGIAFEETVQVRVKGSGIIAVDVTGRGLPGPQVLVCPTS